MLRLFLFLITVLQFSIIHIESNAQNNDFLLSTVVIDAGHGGKDPGAVVGNLKEKDIVLDVALRTGKVIKKHFPEVNVIYTRETDTFIPLNKRTEIANKQKADLFISIHVNYFKSESVNGSETYILGPHKNNENLEVAQMENSVILLEDDYTRSYEGFDPNEAESDIMFELIQNEYLDQSMLLAHTIQSEFEKLAKKKSRGVRQAGFLVLWQTTMPSILIELGFISNTNEKKYLQTNQGKQNLANAIAKAFGEYKIRNDERSKISIIEEKPKNEKIVEDSILKIATNLNEGKWYATQIIASASQLKPNSNFFKNSSPVYEYYEGGWHKYYINITSEYNTFQSKHKTSKNKFKGAFPVVFENGKKEKFYKF
ncbi:MAG: N-acetylmuramoyl-L-alanine amidase [Prolixibacteraceae bacterium]|jgi:N-acetylmuramoyl-L-alanine amidase|nr:N-acetylmuramoyl-L-alanine amidase [Prolixibacteraceae bacterium]